MAATGADLLLEAAVVSIDGIQMAANLVSRLKPALVSVGNVCDVV